MGLALLGAVSQGILWGIMVLGVFITYKLLDIADLTVDGSFALGGCVCAVLVVAGVNPLLAILAAMLAGMVAGAVTGFLHTVFEIPAILAGILTQIGLWSINLRIMGKSNTPLLKNDTIFSQVTDLTDSPPTSLPSSWAPSSPSRSSPRCTGSSAPRSARPAAPPVTTRPWSAHWASTQSHQDDRPHALQRPRRPLRRPHLREPEVRRHRMGTGAIVIGLAAIVIGEVLGRLTPASCAPSAAASPLPSWAPSCTSSSAPSCSRWAWTPRHEAPVRHHRGPRPVHPRRVGEVPAQAVLHSRRAFRRGAIGHAEGATRLQDLQCRHHQRERALVNVDLHLEPGDFVTVIGGNGAGKSTLMNMIAGVYPIDSGVIELDGKDISLLSEPARASTSAACSRTP